ncbi:MAG: SprB repeat-containing protein, partial [Bacteroidota bacterium]
MKRIIKFKINHRFGFLLTWLMLAHVCLGLTSPDPNAAAHESVLSVQIANTDVLCFGDQNGTLSANVTGGTAPYTYLWNTGATTSSLDNMAPGVYLVTVTDANGETADDSAKIEEPEALVLETSSNFETCTGSADAHVAVNVNGGTGERTYVWSNGMTGFIIEGVSAGEYQVTVTDANGCSAVASQTVELSPEGVWIMTSSTDVTCPGGNDGTAHVGAMTGEAPYTYLWSDPAMQTGDDAFDLSAGTYFVTVTDNNGCTAIG